MTIHLNRSGVWYQVTDTDTPYIKDGLVWKAALSVWVKKSDGNWVQQWPSTGGGTVVPPPAPPPGQVSIVDMNLTTQVASGAICEASYTLRSDRYIEARDDNGINVTQMWVDSNGSPSNYEVMATGEFNVGNKGVWEVLSTSKKYGLNRTTDGSSSATATISIRNKNTQVILDTAVITFNIARGGTDDGGGVGGGSGGGEDPPPTDPV